MSRILFVVPSRDRDAQEQQFCIDFPKYLEKETYITDYKIALIKQNDTRGFNLGWNINVGFDLFERDNPELNYLYQEDDRVVFLPIDGCPINLENFCPDKLLNDNLVDVWDFYCIREAQWPQNNLRPTTHPFEFSQTEILLCGPLGYGWWNNLGFSGPYDPLSPRLWNTYGIYYKALGLGREAYRKINGHTNQYFGWGGDDDNLLARLKLHEIDTKRALIIWTWYYGGSQNYDAVQEPHADRLKNITVPEMLTDGISTLKYTAEIQQINSRIYRATVTQS